MQRSVLLMVLCNALAACSADSGDLAPLRLIHTPAVGQLNAEQLKKLSIECEQYSPHQSMRGRYDAAYCEEAIAAWGDAPLQIVTIDQRSSTTP